MGGIMLDETGDRSTMQDTYNIFEGFSLSSIYLKGRTGPRTHLLLDAQDVNLDDRKGRVDFRSVGILSLRARYDESRRIFDPAADVNAHRKNLWSSLSLTPSKWLWLTGDYGFQKRTGDRLGLTGTPEGWLGTAYDSDLNRWRVEAQARASSGIGGTVAYDAVKQTDGIDPLRARDGHVVSVDVHVPGVWFDRLTHVVRGAAGRSNLPESNVGFDMTSVQYTGILEASRRARLRYRFYASRVDDEATTNKTDNYQHDVDVSAGWKAALVSLGYGWEALDDDRSVTTANTLRGALSLRHPNDKVSGRVSYATRDKTDTESRTLLKDTEYSRLDVSLEGRPTGEFSLGGRVAERTRDMPDIGSRADGLVASAHGTWRHEHFGNAGVIASNLGVEYAYADDEYQNLASDQHVVSHAVTGRLGISVFERLDLEGALTYLKAENDLDIEKSIISMSAAYRLPKGFLTDVKYNIYNYDDYLVAGRFYTANVVWVNVGYAFSTE